MDLRSHSRRFVDCYGFSSVRPNQKVPNATRAALQCSEARVRPQTIITAALSPSPLLSQYQNIRQNELCPSTDKTPHGQGQGHGKGLQQVVTYDGTCRCPCRSNKCYIT